MKKFIPIAGFMAAALLLSTRAEAQVSAEDFKTMQQQLQDVQKALQQSNTEIQQLKQKLGATNKEVSDANAKFESAAREIRSTPQVSEESQAKQHLVIAGYTDVDYSTKGGGVNNMNGSFILGHFAPIFLYRLNDQLLCEASTELSLNQHGDTNFNLEYAQIDYAYNDFITFIGGRFLLPLGFVREKTDPAWINKLPINPLSEGQVPLIPENDVGFQMRGAFHIGDPTLSYALYVVNGPGSATGTDLNGNKSETVEFGHGIDNNGRPSGGGRLAVFYPWEPTYDVEVGVSGQTGTYNNDDSLQWSAGVVDAAIHLGSYWELRGEYLRTWTDVAHQDPTNLDWSMTTERRQGWWTQASYKLAGLNLDFPLINNMEAVFRVGAVSQPHDGVPQYQPSLNYGHVTQYVPGLIYYINNTFQLKACYEFDNGNMPGVVNTLTLQAVYGF